MISYKVRINTIRKRELTKDKNGKARYSYQVRWTVEGGEFTKTFTTSALADSFRSSLLKAARDGEGFDTKSGLPTSMLEPEPETAPTWLEFAADYVDMKWKNLAARSRETTVESLAAMLPALVDDLPGKPDMRTLRQTLRRWYLPPAARKPDAPEAPPVNWKALHWLRRASLPVTAIKDSGTARGVLDAMLLTMDGTPGKANTVLRRRRVVGNVIKYAIEVGHLDDDPFKRITWTPPKASKRLDRRRVPNPAQITELLTAVSYVGSWERGRGRRLVAFFACMYYAMMRPEEVIALRVSDCYLPDKGWGLLTLEKATPTAGKAWTDSGKLHDDKGLKQRAVDEIRPVPIPPVLVAMLKEHIREFSAKNSDGRVFGNERGGRIVASTYSRVWREARAFAMTPDRVDSLLAAVPYDLRHAGVSLGLRSTRDPALIAERAGHSVEIMMSTYSWVLDDQDKIANKAIEEALGGDPHV